jgi:CubicO group peptidase (beta-lactamase class C family)
MKFHLIFIALVILSFACSKAVVESSSDTAVQRKLNAYLSETVDRLDVAGLTVAVTRNDSVIYTDAFGYRNIQTKEPLKPHHVFHWASVSKTFVATAIMQLWEKHKIDLDEKLTAYLPYFSQQDEFYKDITIRQMLNHTSGIGDVDDYGWDKPQYDSGALERFVKSTAHDKMLFAPGKDMQYSNTAFEMLGDVIAKVSGMSFETYVRKNILEPLEMNTTSFLYPEIPDSLRVSGHQWAGSPIVSKHYPYNRQHGPSSTLNSNVIEMTQYAFAHLNYGVYKDKRILADSTYDLWWTNSVALADKSKIGLAWWLGERNGVKLISHTGGDTGFRSIFLLVPEKKISIMLVGNYELLRTYDLAASLLDILTGIKPLPVKRQIGFMFAEVMKREGIDAAEASFEKIKSDSVLRKFYLWDEDDAAFTYPGYLFMEHEMYPDAEQMFKFNLKQFPNSGWAHAHLATGYATSGNKVMARKHFKKAIELLPDEVSFKKELDKLGK